LPRAPARIKSLRDRHAAVAQSLAHRPDIDAAGQETNSVRMPTMYPET